SGALRLRAQLLRRRLREPDDARVVPEVLVAQLGMAVEPERAHHDLVERTHEEVRQEVGAGLLLHELAHLVPREDAVAVGAVGADEAVERTARPAVGVGQHDVIISRRRGDCRRDPLRAAVQLGRQGADVEVPAAPGRDLLHVARERATGDDDLRHAGNASWSTNRSLKSLRPESSTYSTSSTMEF